MLLSPRTKQSSSQLVMQDADDGATLITTKTTYRLSIHLGFAKSISLYRHISNSELDEVKSPIS